MRIKKEGERRRERKRDRGEQPISDLRPPQSSDTNSVQQIKINQLLLSYHMPLRCLETAEVSYNQGVTRWQGRMKGKTERGMDGRKEIKRGGGTKAVGHCVPVGEILHGLGV